MTILEQMLEDTKSVAILGHIRPDGDCLGSTLGLYNYLRLNYPDIRAAVYLEESSPKFSYLKGYDTIRHQVDGECYELCVCLDSGDIQRLGDFKHYLDQADKSLCLDHHVTNTRYGGTNVVPDEASSTCEVLFDQLDEGKLDRYTAECLYTGIIHDTGVFKFSCTSAHTMEKEVRRISSGVSALTFANTWLSVMTILGFLPREASVSLSPFSLTTTDTASASRISRMVCCWGRIRRPLGAALSMGTTRTARSDCESRSPTIFRLVSWVLPSCARHSLSAVIP